MSAKSLATTVLAGLLGMVLLPMVLVAVLFSDEGQAGCSTTAAGATQPAESATAQTIPAAYLTLYQQAGRTYGIPWSILAGVGEVETDHGRSTQPGVHSGENQAGAGGPMQFLQATWNTYGVDGDHDGHKDRYNPADAIPGAANYLRRSGAPDRMRQAIFAYNHSESYVDLVLAWSRRYSRQGTVTASPVAESPAGSPPASATGPEDASAGPPGACTGAGQVAVPGGLVGKIITFALAQRGKPYVFGATGPDAWDCSSLVQGAYRAAGIAIPRTTFEQWPFGVQIPKGREQPGDLVFFNSGPGTSSSSPGHVGLVIGGGKMVVARCTACRPAITTQSYKRPDWIGVTRPLAKPSVQQQLGR